MKNATLGHGVKILQLIAQKGTSGEQIQELISSGLLSDILNANIGAVDRNEFRKLLGLNTLNIYHVDYSIYRLAVDYGQSVEEAVEAGRYDRVNSDITSKNFPTKKSGIAEVSIDLVCFNRDTITADEVLVELDKRGLRPAETHELLKIGEKFPDLQREFPIVALGSVWSVWQDSFFLIRSCPYLDGDCWGRNLGLVWFDGEWSSNCRFAAVRK